MVDQAFGLEGTQGRDAADLRDRVIHVWLNGLDRYASTYLASHLLRRNGLEVTGHG